MKKNCFANYEIANQKETKTVLSFPRCPPKPVVPIHLPIKNASRLSVNGGFRCAKFVFRLLPLYELKPLSRASAALASELLICIGITGATLVKHLIRIVPSSNCGRPKVICKPWTVVTKPCVCTMAGYEMTDVSYTY